MKVTPTITKPKPVVTPPPSLDKVTIELTGREAFLLAAHLGSFNNPQNLANCNKSHDAMPVEDYPKSVSAPAKYEEMNTFWHIYDAIDSTLKKAKTEGVA